MIQELVWTTKEFRYWGQVGLQDPFFMEWTGVDEIVWGPIPSLTLYGYLPKTAWMTHPPKVMTIECWGDGCIDPRTYGVGRLRWRAEGARPLRYWTPQMPLDNDVVMTTHITFRCDSLIANVWEE